MVWLKFGDLLHKIVSPVVMTGLFVFSIVPIGLVLRLFGKDLLRMRIEPGLSTY